MCCDESGTESGQPKAQELHWLFHHKSLNGGQRTSDSSLDTEGWGPAGRAELAVFWRASIEDLQEWQKMLELMYFYVCLGTVLRLVTPRATIDQNRSLMKANSNEEKKEKWQLCNVDTKRVCGGNKFDCGSVL